jgi:outer membrane receptor for ferrienterochelin and colicins
MVRSFIPIIIFILGQLTGIYAQAPADSVAWQINLDDIVVTAQYAPTDSRNALHDIRAIKKETIEKRGATTLEQLFNQEVNIRINQDMILGSSMSLLGIHGQNVKIMMDGVPVIGRQDGNIDLSQINLHTIERVEIVEGPLSVNYGTDALAGVVNLISKKSQLNKYEARITANLEDRGENSYTGFFGIRPADRLLIQLNGGFDRFDGFSNDTLRSVLWNPKEQWSFDGSLRYTFPGNHDLRYAYSYFDEDVTNLGEVRRPQFKPYAFDDYYHTLRSNHSVAHEGTVFDQYYTQTTVGYNLYKRYKNTYRTDFEQVLEEEIAGQQDTATFEGVTLRSAFASQYENRLLNFQLGIDLRYDNATGQRIQDSLSNRENFSEIGDYALFGSVRFKPLESMQLEAGLRFAHNTRYDAPFVPSFNARYELSDFLTLRASYGKGFRSPDLKELFFNFIDINHFIVGNPNLEAEKSDNVQVGLSYLRVYERARLGIKVKGFYNHIRDKIELYEYINTPGGITPVTDTSTLQFAYFNQDVYKTHGTNLSFDYQWKQFHLNTNFSIIGYYNPDSEISLEVDPFTYAFELSNSVDYEILKYGLSLSLFIRNNDKRISFFPDVNEDGATVTGQRILDGFTMMDVTLTKHFWQKRITFTAGVKNLLDVQEVDVTRGGIGGAPNVDAGTSPVGTGRNFFIRSTISFGWK